jgi:ferredoxin-type protein NapH
VTLQQTRTLTRTAFFLLFLLAPVLNIFRFDLTLGHFVFFNQAWTLNIENILAGDSLDAALRIFSRILVPFLAFISITGLLIWKYGRIYCGWLCPHFSVVEMFNKLMLKQLNRVTVWEKPSKSNNAILPKLVVAVPSIIMAFIWAIGLLGYLLPPKIFLVDLIHLQLGFGASIFIVVATVIFSFDFIFTRHVFCKYGCALGLFQSLIWMANKKAMVIKFDRDRAKACRECSLNSPQKACDAACPMRLPTRNMKRAKFTCTQCGQCVSACTKVQNESQASLLNWVSGERAVEVDRPASKFEIDIKEIK